MAPVPLADCMSVEDMKGMSGTDVQYLLIEFHSTMAHASQVSLQSLLDLLLCT